MNEHLNHNEHHNQNMSSHNDGTVAEATVQPPVASETKTRKKPTNHEAAAIKFNAMMAKQIAIASVKPLSRHLPRALRKRSLQIRFKRLVS